MFVSLLKRYWTYIAVAGISIFLTMWLSPKQIEIEEKVVTEVQERVRVVTRVIERPDGTKETIIDEKKETDFRQDSERVTTPAGTDWSISLSQSISGEYQDETVYTLGVQRSLFWGLSGGVYARTDKEVGAILTYSF